MITISVLLFISALLMYLWLALQTDYKQNFVREHELLNGGHNTFVISGRENDLDAFLEENMNDSRVKSFTATDVIACEGTCDYEGNLYRSLFVCMKKDDGLSRKDGRYKILEERNVTSGVYLPYNFFVSGSYKIGDNFELKTPDKNYNFTVAGFFECILSSDVVCDISSILLTDDCFKELKQSPLYKTRLLSVTLFNEEDSDLFGYEFDTKVSQSKKLVCWASNTFENIYNRKYACVLFAFSVIGMAGFIVFAISLVVIGSSINDFISKNMKEFGSLKALGYQSKQLIGSMALQFSVISILSIVLGALSANLVFIPLNKLLIAQTAVPYKIYFIPTIFFITLGILFVLTIITVLFASHKIVSIEPIAAIRDTRNNGTSGATTVSLENTKLPVNTALAFKTTLTGWIKNAVIILTLFGVSIGIAISVMFYENTLKNIDPTIEMSTPIASVAITVSENDVASVIDFANNCDDVTSILQYTLGQKVLINGSSTVYSTVLSKGDKSPSKAFCYDGRLPENENEVMLGGLFAKENNIKIGDVVSIKLGEKEVKYSVIGLSQFINNFGDDVTFIKEGYEQLTSLSNIQLLISLNQNGDRFAFMENLKEAFPTASIHDYRSFIDGQFNGFAKLLRLIVLGIISLCIFVIGFVINIFVRMTLESKRTDFGVLKAIGFTTKQLIGQTLQSFMPVIIIGLGVGSVIACSICNLLYTFFAGQAGVMKAMFEFSKLNVFLFAALAAVYAFALICIFAKKIKKISPHDLLVGN